MSVDMLEDMSVDMPEDMSRRLGASRHPAALRRLGAWRLAVIRLAR